MIFTPLPLQGAYLISIEENADERGFFARMFCKDEFKALGLNDNWAQINNSYSKRRGTLRGLHLQRAPFAEVKVVRCLRGAVWDVIVDIRPTSKTFGSWYGLEINDDNRTMIYVPEGFAHGFITLTDHAEIMYLVSKPYSKTHEIGLQWNDSDIAIHWPISPSVLSDKDKCNFSLKDITHENLAL